MDSIVSGRQASMKAAVAALHFARSHTFDRQASCSFEPRDTSELSSTLQSAALLANKQGQCDLPHFDKKSLSSVAAKNSLLLQDEPLMRNAA